MALDWIDRDLIRGPYMLLCTRPEEFKAAKAHLEVEDNAAWPDEGWAKLRCYDSKSLLGFTAIVLLGDVSKCSGIEICGLLTHEAVHVFQEYCEHIGERYPSAEFEAYSIQSIAQRLWTAYERQVLTSTPEPSPASPS